MMEYGADMISEKVFIDIGGNDRVSARLSGPEHGSETNGIGIIIAHGAGNDMHNPLIVALADGLAAAGTVTLRFNFPYKEKGKKSPDSQKILVHTWQSAYAYMRGNTLSPVDRIIAAGKSMGGRVASQMVADGQMDAAAMIFSRLSPACPGQKRSAARCPPLPDQSALAVLCGNKGPPVRSGKTEQRAGQPGVPP
jgi:predicted alpha/beta-hydrolase family hydrolase